MVRFCFFLSLSHLLGPLFAIARKVFDDVQIFLILFVILNTGFFILLNLRVQNRIQLGVLDLECPQGDDSHSCIMWQQIWGNFADISIWDNLDPLTNIIIAIAFFNNVVILLNLLIAMMSNSFAVLAELSSRIFYCKRTEILAAYRHIHHIPPPFNLIIIVPRILGAIINHFVTGYVNEAKEKENEATFSERALWTLAVCQIQQRILRDWANR